MLNLVNTCAELSEGFSEFVFYCSGESKRSGAGQVCVCFFRIWKGRVVFEVDAKNVRDTIKSLSNDVN